jgi:hypothetical protein
MTIASCGAFAIMDGTDDGRADHGKADHGKVHLSR